MVACDCPNDGCGGRGEQQSLIEHREYFEEVVAKRQYCGLKIKPDGENGKELQIGRKLHLQELGVSADDECGSSDGPRKRNSIPRDTISVIDEWELAVTIFREFPLPSVFPCQGGCGEAYYCSKSCAEADWDSFHSLLCIGNGSSSPNTEALSKFMQHANGKAVINYLPIWITIPRCTLSLSLISMLPFSTLAETNDIFILAAKVISYTILRYRKFKAAHKRWGKHTQGGNCFFLCYWRHGSRCRWDTEKNGRWWDCIALPEDVDSCDETEFRMQIKDLAFESLQLLKEAIYDKECAPLFSLDIYGHIIGMFELNNLDLVVASPVEDYFLYIDDLPLSQKKEAEKITKSCLDALGEDYSVSCEGTAFFPLQSCMNHSCIPNAKAFKREEDRDGQATILALRPIIKGEEITISYIDEELPYEERQELLADYGFTCKCPRCSEEQP
ncbi:hypothetical protein BUALT_Bualt18G0017500 [Buddleja alternifolia]|uniref:SET domain-containing protein n=1 Tax=Buddleja alternifolia TaxID=168488 RepID=A0AAV6W1K6_9LAMI|nr:hypothetical protein BUALT_Bualt18G0017500 [Buddleja alternifolia]